MILYDFPQNDDLIAGNFAKTNEGAWMHLSPSPAVFALTPQVPDDRPMPVMNAHGQLLMGYYAEADAPDAFPAYRAEGLAIGEEAEMLDYMEKEGIPITGTLQISGNGRAEFDLWQRGEEPLPQTLSHTLTVDVAGGPPLSIGVQGLDAALESASVLAEALPAYPPLVIYSQLNEQVLDAKSITLSETETGRMIGNRWDEPVWSGQEDPGLHGAVGLGLGGRIRGLDAERGVDRLMTDPEMELIALCEFAGQNLNLNTSQILQAFAQTRGHLTPVGLVPLSQLMRTGNDVLPETPSVCYINGVTLDDNGCLRMQLEPAYDSRDTLHGRREPKPFEALAVAQQESGSLLTDPADACRAQVAAIREDPSSPLVPQNAFELEAAAAITQMQFGLPLDRGPVQEAAKTMAVMLPEDPGERRAAVESTMRRMIGGAREATGQIMHRFELAKSRDVQRPQAKEAAKPKKKAQAVSR